MKVSLILACAGSGARAGFNHNKLWEQIDGKSVIDHTISAFRKSNLIDEIIITASEVDFEKMSALYSKDCVIAKGGDTRTQSVKNALDKVTGEIVLIHDGARPFVTQKMISNCIETAKATGSAIPIIPTPNTMVRLSDEDCEYLGKGGIYSIQTPQGFLTKHITNAYARACDKSFNDDGEVYKEFIGKLSFYDGDAKNVKLTYANDFVCQQQIRFGVGFDCHRLVENRKLILGGVTIPHDKGLLGHSDADVLTHAVMDAMLSALSLRDIGYHFSDKDPQYKDADSMKLLDRVIKMLDDKGYKVDSISACIMAEKPKLLTHIPTITSSLATALNLPLDKVGITATTLEGLGFVGREEGICVHANAVVVKHT